MSVERTSRCSRCRDSLRRGELSRETPIRPSFADNSEGAVDELVAREASSEIVQNLSLKQRQTLC